MADFIDSVGHGIGHQLGPLGVGHGETSCIMLPAVLKFNYLHGNEKVKKLQQKVLDVFWAEKTVAEVLTQRGLQKKTADAGDVVGAVVSELGMPRSLKDVGVRREQLDALADNCLKDPWLKTNPVSLTEKKQVLEILEMVVGDGKSSL
jgi:alcohol dehydrogenase class IV